MLRLVHAVAPQRLVQSPFRVRQHLRPSPCVPSVPRVWLPRAFLRSGATSAQKLKASDVDKKDDGEEEIWKPSKNIRQLSFLEDPKLFMSRLPGLIKSGAHHLWVGTKLLGLNVYTAAGLVSKTLRGKMLSRREKRLLVNTAADIFRLVPFSFFVIVPLAEFALPFFLKIFPNMIPSTFTSRDEVEEKLYKKVKARLEMAKFLLKTRESLKTQSPDFSVNFKSVMDDIKSGQPVSKEQVYKFVTLFKDDLTLANIRRSQIQAMCRFIGITPIGPTDFLRGQLSARIDALKTDDKLIKAEGLSSLSLIELKQAVAARGMSSYGPRKELEALMEEWLDLSLNQKVPTALLILSRAYRMLPHQHPDELLRATLTKVPEKVLEEVQSDVEFAHGEDPLQAKLDRLKEERKKLKEEAAHEAAEAAEIIGEHTPLDTVSATPNVVQDDLTKVVQASDALDALANPVEEETVELQTIGAQLLEETLLPDKTKVADDTTPEEKHVEDPIEKRLKEMVKQIDDDIKQAKAKIVPSIDLDRDGRVTMEEIRSRLEKLGKLTQEDIETIVAKLDTDKDGFVDLDQITAVSRLEADIITMAMVVEVEEKKRIESLREKVEDIIEEEKERDAEEESAPVVGSDQDVTHLDGTDEVTPETETETETAIEMKENTEDTDKPTELETKDAKEDKSTEEVNDKEKELVEEVLRKEATAPPVTPLPPSNEEALASPRKKSVKKEKVEREDDEVLTHVSNEGKAEGRKTQGKDMAQ